MKNKKQFKLIFVIVVVVSLSFWVPRLISQYHQKNQLQEMKSSYEKLMKNSSSINENTVDNLISFKIPENWRLYSENELKRELEILKKNTSIEGYFDYFFRLKTDETYPYISITLEQNEDYNSLNIEDFANELKHQFNIDFFKTIEDTYNLPLDFKDGGNYIDKRNKILYLFIEGNDPFVGEIKTAYGLLLRNNYVIGVFLTATKDNYQDNVNDYYEIVKSIKLNN